MTKITKAWLTRHNACADGVEFVTEKGLIGLDAAEFVEALIKLDELPWANWLIVRCLDRPNQIRYACFAARDVLVAKDHPVYSASLAAIEAAEACIESDTPQNRQKAEAAAADAARAAADSAAAWVAWAAADSAAARGARGAGEEAAAWASGYMASAIAVALRKYIRHGLKLLKEGGK